ncbi:MAG TPA: hypothetical protein ACFYEK_01360 [Candidatus Wunengus sp. YC60]|uniref:hypothetical protein n=1 Tax=Candidatus Wunengus sp. YC60 TaxID=3367697 RepID=UPI0040253C45
MNANKCQINLVANAIKVTFQDPNNPFAPDESINRVTILGFGGVFNQKPLTAKDEEWIYPYDAMTQIMVTMQDNKTFIIELQNVTNQPTWSTGTYAGVQAALVALNAWL